MQASTPNRTVLSRCLATAGASALMALGAVGAIPSQAATTPPALNQVVCNAAGDKCEFYLVRTAARPSTCLPNVGGKITIRKRGAVEKMTAQLWGLPKNTEFDLFVIQVPKAPFGLAWYQGDIESDSYGHAEQDYRGRFNEETFIVAQSGNQPLAPHVHNKQPFPDAVFGQTTQVGPIHTFHVGVWFNSPADAFKAGCEKTVTPFNGEHNAGVQILNTAQFPDNEGPLSAIKP